mmetsp:Transcript_24734/g.37867  ORF Transcript_24734/g.37867 Transcript_24734/m.37867 type:complete len:107 (-) Transcript_24734:408-728(-)
MAMACIGFGLSLEFGWHVADSWYYENNFHVLNFGFYFFLISGFALWADGFKNIAIFDLIFGGILAGATFLYPFGNAAQVVSYAFCLHKKLINRHEPNSFSFRANVG